MHREAPHGSKDGTSIGNRQREASVFAHRRVTSLAAQIGNRAFSNLIQANHHTERDQQALKAQFDAVLLAVEDRDHTKLRQLLPGFRPANLAYKFPFLPIETAVKLADLTMVKGLFDCYAREGMVPQLKSGEKNQVAGRPIYWLAGVCAAAGAPLQESCAVIDYLEQQLEVKDDQRKVEYLRAWQSAHPEKVQSVIEHYSLDIDPGVRDPGPQIDASKDRSANPNYVHFAKK